MGRKKQYAAHGPLLVELYVDRGLSLSEIADVTGIHPRTIGRMLNERNVQMRPRGNRKGSCKKRR